MKIDLSIIIPTYNRLWALPKAVESCRGTACRTEIIVVDDGSTDGTWAWLQEQQDVISIVQTNRGKTWAVNRGFERASGDYVRFLDSDDWCLAGANDGQLQIARSAAVDVVVGGCQVFSETETELETCPWICCDDFIAQQLGECPASHYSAYLFRKDFVGDIPHRPDLAFRDDRMFLLEVAMKHPRVAIYDSLALGHLHHTKGRLQFQTGLKATVTNYQHLSVYRQVLGELARRNELTPRRKKAACKVLWPLAHWIGKTHPAEAAEVADWVYMLDPEFQPPEGGALGQFYRRFGFRRTEALLRLRRRVLYSGR